MWGNERVPRGCAASGVRGQSGTSRAVPHKLQESDARATPEGRAAPALAADGFVRVRTAHGATPTRAAARARGGRREGSSAAAGDAAPPPSIAPDRARGGATRGVGRRSRAWGACGAAGVATDLKKEAAARPHSESRVNAEWRRMWRRSYAERRRSGDGAETGRLQSNRGWTAEWRRGG
jgi:hypothetical protein